MHCGRVVPCNEEYLVVSATPLQAWVDTNLEAPGLLLQQTQRLAAMVEQWQAQVRRGRERYPNQLDLLLTSLGPPPSRPDKYALWVAALINPLPVLGVAPEIRPKMLATVDVIAQLEIVESALRMSLEYTELAGWLVPVYLCFGPRLTEWIKLYPEMVLAFVFGGTCLAMGVPTSEPSSWGVPCMVVFVFFYISDISSGRYWCSARSEEAPRRPITGYGSEWI